MIRGHRRRCHVLTAIAGLRLRYQSMFVFGAVNVVVLVVHASSALAE